MEKEDDFAEDDSFVDDMFPSVASSSDSFFWADKVSLSFDLRDMLRYGQAYTYTYMYAHKVYMFLKSHAYYVCFITHEFEDIINFDIENLINQKVLEGYSVLYLCLANIRNKPSMRYN